MMFGDGGASARGGEGHLTARARPSRWDRAFATLFFLTGVFAVLGAGYTWGKGSIFQQKELVDVLIPWADIVVTGPVSVAAAFALWTGRRWGPPLACATSGVYVFGSVLVFLTMVLSRAFSPLLFVPACFGLLLGAAFVASVIVRAEPSPDR
jgi:hypothetical protein